MANVHDVAAAIIDRVGPMTAMKLQKLAYYCQAWHLVWDEKPMFESPIEAWANGPVCRDLYERHRGAFTVTSWDGDPSALSEHESSTVDAVLRAYAPLSAAQLSQLTHDERPWRDARLGLQPGQRGNQDISLAAMAEYYEGLYDDAADTADVEELASELA